MLRNLLTTIFVLSLLGFGAGHCHAQAADSVMWDSIASLRDEIYTLKSSIETVTPGSATIDSVVVHQQSEKKEYASWNDQVILYGKGFMEFEGKRIVLFINDIPFDSVYPKSANLPNGQVVFELRRTKKMNDLVPNDFLEVLKAFSKVAVKVSFGEVDGKFIEVNHPNLQLEFYPKWDLFLGITCSLLLGLALIWLGRTTNLLRVVNTNSIKNPAYSLSSTQMGWWTFIIVTSVGFLWIVNGELVLSSQALILLGISIATAAGSNAVDANAKGKNREFDGSDGKPSDGFWNDLMSDSQGYSIHRFQNVVFTLLVGFYFLIQTISDLEMPVLDDNILLVLGISSGAYVALKPFERPGNAATKTLTPEAPTTKTLTDSQDNPPA